MSGRRTMVLQWAERFGWLAGAGLLAIAIFVVGSAFYLALWTAAVALMVWSLVARVIRGFRAGWKPE